MLVQVRFGFTKMKRFIGVYGSGSGSVRHPGFIVEVIITLLQLMYALVQNFALQSFLTPFQVIQTQ